MKTRILFLLFLLGSCAGPEKQTSHTTDKTLRKKDAPAFLLAATPHGDDIDDVEYFIKNSANGKSYELKYEQNDEEVSVHFDEAGKFLEREQDIKFSSLDSAVQEKIKQHLEKRFEKYRIAETELRTTAEKKELIDVEVSHHEKPTGLSELSFTLTGDFVSEEVEHNPHIETLN